MVVAYLEKFGEATRAELDELLIGKVSDALNAYQKRRFIANLLQEMKKAGRLMPDGVSRWAKWRLTKTPSEAKDSRRF
jgi:ATP-dependent DNA helicase RecG